MMLKFNHKTLPANFSFSKEFFPYSWWYVIFYNIMLHNKQEGHDGPGITHLSLPDCVTLKSSDLNHNPLVTCIGSFMI